MTNQLNIEQQLTSAAALLAVYDTARLDAEVLLAHVLGKSRTYLFAWADKAISSAEALNYAQLINRRLAGEPVAYILGWQEFWSLALKVTPATLIPRPETEQLVDAVLARFDNSTITVWDAGTGTGAIALALASERADWQIYASDYSAEALAVAAQNIAHHQLQVQLCRADWLSAVADQTLDLLVSNPPYIPPQDEHLAALRYEPISALAAADEGLADIKKLIVEAKRVLKPLAFIYIEHGYDQGDIVPELLMQQGFSQAHCIKDYAGQPRFTVAQWLGNAA